MYCSLVLQALVDQDHVCLGSPGTGTDALFLGVVLQSLILQGHSFKGLYCMVRVLEVLLV
jgi:hypothetical protein